MAPSQTPAPYVDPAAAAGSQTPLQPIPSLQPHCLLWREGAIIFLSAAEQAIEDAMMRSSPTPEPVLGKRARQAHGATDGNATEPDDRPPLTTQPQSLPSISNVAAATLRYVLKKLHPEQRDEVDAFLLVSTPLTYLLGPCLNIDQDTALGRQAKLFACILALENKVNTFRSAAPPYQLSDELKVHVNPVLHASMLNRSMQ